MNSIILKIIIYFILTLIITVCLALFQQKINLDYGKIVLPQLAPALGFLVISLIFKELKFSVNFGFSFPIALKTFSAVIIPFSIFFTAFILCRIAGIDVYFTKDASVVFPALIVGIVSGAIGEEIGWRSFLQPELEKHYSIIISSVIVGVVWGLWHIGHYKNGIVFMAGFFLFTISASIILAWLLRGTGFNIIISSLFHISINLGYFLFFKETITNPKIIVITGVIWLIPALIIFYINKNEMINL